MTAAATPDNTVIEFPGARNGFLYALAIVSALLAGSIVLLVLTHKLPIYITAMLVIVAGGCAAILFVILDQFFGTKLTVTDDAIIVGRLCGGATYPWPRIEDLKVVAPTNSLGDNPFAEHAKRFGLGIFLTNSGRHRENDLDADVVVCSVPEEMIETLINHVDRLRKLRPRSGVRPATAPAPPKIGAKKRDFRQRRSSIAAG